MVKLPRYCSRMLARQSPGERSAKRAWHFRARPGPPVARRSLSAESQAASECADSLLFVSTFWKLLWRPTLPEQEDTPVLAASPAIVIDAKALYDLLTKAFGANKRTAIEVLVCQDKLKACQANPALLADCLRTHELRVKGDESVQAAKKKDPWTRKKNTEMFAVKKGSRAMQAMFCLGSTTITLATSTSSSTWTTTSWGSWILWVTMVFASLLPLLLWHLPRIPRERHRRNRNQNKILIHGRPNRNQPDREQ